MNQRIQQPEVSLALFLSTEHTCSYLPEQNSQTLFVDPAFPMDMTAYQALLDRGFRRSGNHIYRPHCPYCASCVALRLPLEAFRPNRSQRRCWNKNHPLIQVRIRPPRFDENHYKLFQKYIKGRHPRGGMDNSSPDEYMEFLTAPWCQTVFFEFRLDGQLVGIAVTDILPRSFSAIYTFFDPRLKQYGLGVYALLNQIEYARMGGRSWLYLGYWIADCDKMNYKDAYRPLEGWTGYEWKRFAAGQPIDLSGST